MSINLNNPGELEWTEGDLPDVHSVPYDCCAVVWAVYNETVTTMVETEPGALSYKCIGAPEFVGKFAVIGIVHPWEDNLNSLRWSGVLSCRGDVTVKYWAWLDKGRVDL